MTIDEVLQLTRARLQKDLHPVQEIILRQVWEGKTYTSIASTSHYGEHYLRNIASGLWQSLSEILEKPLSKSNFRFSLESRSLTAEEQELIQESIRSQSLATLFFRISRLSRTPRFAILYPSPAN